MSDNVQLFVKAYNRAESERVGYAFKSQWVVESDESLAVAVAEAEARGYHRAIAVMRDDSAYWEHQRKTGEYDGGRHFIADWVESQASAHTAIRSGESTDDDR